MVEDELVAVTTYVPRSRVADFQLHAATWVSSGSGPPVMVESRAPGPFASDQRPDWGEAQLPLAEQIHRKMAKNSVAVRVLTRLLETPDGIQPDKLADKLNAENPNADKLLTPRAIAACWGHVGRYCIAANAPLPFQWNNERGYWVTPATAEILKQAGFGRT